MELPLLLWIDFLSRDEEPGLRERFASHFNVVPADSFEQLDQVIARVRPSALCFDFDYPLESQLGVMQAVKRTHSSLPILMLTVDHSEALAVWSFRVRIWNYLVKPIADQELRANLQVLSHVAQVAPRQRREVRLPGPAVENLTTRAAHAYRAILPALEQIEARFRERLSASDMAKLCNLSPFQFSREFRLATNHTFQDHVLGLRIEEACRLLLKKRPMSIAEIGNAVGISDTSYFARIFKRYKKVRPSEYAESSPAQAEMARAQQPRTGRAEADFGPPALLRG